MVIYIGMRNDSVRAEVLSWHDLKQSVRRLALRSIEKFQQSYICDYMHVYRVACIKFCCHAEFLGWHDLKQRGVVAPLGRAILIGRYDFCY